LMEQGSVCTPKGKQITCRRRPRSECPSLSRTCAMLRSVSPGLPHRDGAQASGCRSSLVRAGRRSHRDTMRALKPC
jgi:hypothetical protein